jgi:phage shock protein C
MYCSTCGKPIDPAARFCSACGTAFQPAAAYAYPRRQLTRPRANRMVGGVCAAFAQEYGWELSLTRVIVALLIIFTGVGLIVYLAAWIIIPEEPYFFASPSMTAPVAPASSAGGSDATGVSA